MDNTINNKFFDDTPKTVLVLGGSGGIGKAIRDEIQINTNSILYYTSRNYNDSNSFYLDGTSNSSWEDLCHKFNEHNIKFDLVINCIGILHDKFNGLNPEKSIKEINEKNFINNIKVNTLITAYSLKYLIKYINKSKAIYASLTARLGSISDNNIGGWISYRASKAAEHMVIKTASIELSRNYKDLITIGIHPGTVDTNLSKPFTKNSKNIFTPNEAASKIIGVLNKIDGSSNGKILDYSGKTISY